MTEISATQAKQQFAALLDAAQRGPVRIKRHDREVAVLISSDEYEKMVRDRWREFDRLSALASEQGRVNGLTEEILQEIIADR